MVLSLMHITQARLQLEAMSRVLSFWADEKVVKVLPWQWKTEFDSWFGDNQTRFGLSAKFRGGIKTAL